MAGRESRFWVTAAVSCLLGAIGCIYLAAWSSSVPGWQWWATATTLVGILLVFLLLAAAILCGAKAGDS